MNKHRGCRRWSLTWWKDAGVLLVLMGVVYFSMWFFSRQYLAPEQGRNCFVITACYLILILLLIFLLVHIAYPSAFRRLVLFIVTAVVNRNREVVSPGEISGTLGLTDEEDKSALKVAKSEMPVCESVVTRPAVDRDMLEWLKEIDPNISSCESFFEKVEQSGAIQYYPILHKLINDKNGKQVEFYRLVYELVSGMDASADKDERAYRKNNLRYIIENNDVRELWNFCCAYLDICYKDEDYDSIIAVSQKIIARVEEADKGCSSRRSYVYILLGSIYMERKQYNIAIPYLKEVVRISSITMPALYRLAFIYTHVLQDYEKGLYYSQLCFSKLSERSEQQSDDMEICLIRWIAYCSAACGEYQKGVDALENYLQVAQIPLAERSDIESCLSYLLLKQAKLDKARALATKVLGVDPMNITAVNVKGMCEMSTGNYDVAVNCFRKIIPEFKKEKSRQSKFYLGEIYNNLAICEAKLGKGIDADAHFRDSFANGYPDIDVAQFAKVAIEPIWGAVEERSKTNKEKVGAGESLKAIRDRKSKGST